MEHDMKPCALCGLEPIRGFGSAYEDGVQYWLCHPDRGQDCYLLWTVYGHRPRGWERQHAN